MNKVYLIYATIPTYLFENKYKYLIENRYDYKPYEDNMIGLYAWTTKKELKKEFEAVRSQSNIFNVIKKDDIDDEFEELLTTKYASLELGYRDYGIDNDEYLIICSTKFEHVNSTIDGDENMEEFYEKSYLDDFGLIDYKIFSKEMQVALDTVGYTMKYIETSSDDQEEIDFINYNSSYNMGATGVNLPTMNNNEYEILIYLYDLMFLGTSNLTPNYILSD